MENMIERIAERNCARDDRVISDSGAEYRLPFLDLDFVRLVTQIPLGERCNLTLERGVGEKWLLRELARRKGLADIAGLEKRAIQFGSRMAKMSERKEKGHHQSRELS